MASMTPRASGLWASTNRGYFDSEDMDEENIGSDVLDGRTPLDRTIDRIGMGTYQWVLLSLCGFGWLADNMWIEAIAISLNRVQRHFSVSDQVIGALPSSMHAGMMFGAVGWGACSDVLGRTAAFNGTLVLTAVFGVVAAFAPSFPLLCFSLLLLGTAVGGSMPTDGTLLLENVPRSKQYLVTALSVFFSIGAVLAAVVALAVIPAHSCPPSPAECDVLTMNNGWRYLLGGLGAITTCLFTARVLFFTLHESPRYLVRAGREQDAVQALQLIARYNGDATPIGIADVRDQLHTNGENEGLLPKDNDGSSPPSPERPRHASRIASSTGLFDGPEVKDYSSATNTPPSDLSTPSGSLPIRSHSPPQLDDDEVPPARPRPPKRRTATTRSSMLASRSSYRGESRKWTCVPRFLRGPLDSWLERVSMVLSPRWRRTTLLVWVIWWAMSFAFTMFNVYLPKLLESAGEVEKQKTITESLWDIVIFTLGGCPGALIGAWMVDVPFLGRKRSLAVSTFATAIGCAAFAVSRSAFTIRVTSMFISLAATTMWAVLYGWTPEIFGTEVRGTACGIASALSRIGGMFAPLIGGFLLSIGRALPVYAAVGVFALAGVCTLLIDEPENQEKSDDGPSFVH